MSNEILEQDEFTLLLKSFNEAIADQPSIAKVKDSLLEMKLAATNSNELTFWQKDAIIARCNNYLNGAYGSSSREYEVKARTR